MPLMKEQDSKEQQQKSNEIDINNHENDNSQQPSAKNTQSRFQYNHTQFVIITIAFCMGVSNLSNLAQNYMFKDDFKIAPAELSVIMGLQSIPWIIKPIWGYISDSFPLFGYRRKSYLILWGIIQSACWICMAKVVNTVELAVLTLMIFQLGNSFCSVIGEALLVEVARNNENNQNATEEQKQASASSNVSMFFATRSFGTFLTAYSGGLLLEYIDKRKVFLITATFPAVLVLTSMTLPEQRVGSQSSQEVKHEENERLIHEGAIDQQHHENNQEQEPPKQENNLVKVMKFVSKKEILWPLSVLMIFMITPSTSGPMFYYYTNQLKFHPEFLGQLQLASSLAEMSGIYLYNQYFKHVSFKKLFCVTSIICSLTGLSQILLVSGYNRQLGIPDKFFCIGDSVIIQVFAEINFIPILVLAARMCPKNIEGTMYALLMSTINFGGMLSNYNGGILADQLNITDKNFNNLWLLILIANVSMILPIPLLLCVEFDQSVQLADQESGEENKELENQQKLNIEEEQLQQNNLNNTSNHQQIEVKQDKQNSKNQQDKT